MSNDPIDDTENLYPPAGHPDAVPCTPEETAAYEARRAPAAPAPTPVTMAREHIGAVVRPTPGEAPEMDRLRCIAAGVTFERTRLSARLRARISVLRASPILSEEVDGAVSALEQVLAELGG